MKDGPRGGYRSHQQHAGSSGGHVTPHIVCQSIRLSVLVPSVNLAAVEQADSRRRFVGVKLEISVSDPEIFDS
jgi:hypothetical protein